MSEPYIQCSGHRQMSLLHPRMEDVHLASMAFALAHLNRYTGHAGGYSVAEHLVIGTRYLDGAGASALTQLLYLFHDAHEAYTGDVSQPVKIALKALGSRGGSEVGDVWKEFETLHQNNVRRWLSHTATSIRVPYAEDTATSEKVREIDLRMLITETDQLPALGGRVGDGWPQVPAIPVRIYQWTAMEAFHAFLAEVARLAPELML